MAGVGSPQNVTDVLYDYEGYDLDVIRNLREQLEGVAIDEIYPEGTRMAMQQAVLDLLPSAPTWSLSG